MSEVTTHRITVAGVDVLYRTAGPQTPDAPTFLLLHGFPSSSLQFRNIMPLLAARGYRLIAPDLPGFGQTTAPAGYAYTFGNLAATVEAFVDALHLHRFAIYVFDYGAPTGLRLALDRPESVLAIVSQNGNAYDEGLGEQFWAPVRRYWDSGAAQDREFLRDNALTFEVTLWQYTNGSHVTRESVEPLARQDQDLMERPGNKDIQLDLFYDYRTNLPLYPSFQEYFRTSNVPVLAMWGENDEIFVKAGAEAFRRDVKRLQVSYLDAGHFALEGNEETAVEIMDGFFTKEKVFQ
ncbi:putative hydrolase [Stachybotrys elegans]|uniref:Hydrolase n=1 Tax=Stachybotrys elegans TaxID=80388 RepID=A0A8K0SQ15_9HYPO|nr:putative hydrolase [Stachybotrys elegans]